MTIKLSLVLILSIVFCGVAGADQVLVGGDGKKYRLNDDGTWEVLTENRFLDTPDGRRVILKPDGSWKYLGLAPTVERTKFQSLALAATIKDINIIETKELVGGGKNTRIKSALITKLNLKLSATEKKPFDLSKLSRKQFTITDNGGKRYPVVSVQASKKILKPGSFATIVLESNRAPRRFRKLAEFIVEVAPSTLGNDKSISLSYDYDRVKKRVINK